MDSSPVLRQQSHNKICSDFMRMKNEHNKMPTDLKPSKPALAPHLSKQDSENKDPGTSKVGKKTPVRPGGSRLPVLAKSLSLQTSSDFSQSHCRWEEKPLGGKAKKKKPCTRPVPFNFSQPRSSRATSENQQPITGPLTQRGSSTVQPEKNRSNTRLKANDRNVNPSKHQDVLNSHVDSTLKSHRKATENIPHLLGKSGLPNSLKTPSTVAGPQSAIPNNNTVQSNAASSAHPAVSAETCLENMNQLSLKDPTDTLHASHNTQLTSQLNFSKGSSDKGNKFQTDHAALLSILRNEGVSTAGLGSPESKPYNYLPQRVSVMKSRQKAVPSSAVKLVRFSPDPAALQTILQNEGVKAGGAAIRMSVCQSGRGTSIYTPQRVPVRKNHAEAPGGPVAGALGESPLQKWTPKRVRDTRHQPMSAMKWHLSSQPTPYTGTPRLRSCKTNHQLQQEEEVIQRLFDDPEDEENAQFPAQDSSTKTHCEEKVEKSRANTVKDEEQPQQQQQQRIVGEQPFFQAPHRDSVIFFSTGKNLFRAPRFEKQESSCIQDQHGPVSSEQRKVQPETSFVPEPTAHINPPVQSLHRDISAQKSSGLSPAVALLRKRLPPLEELRMDEEVATYTSVSVSAPSGFLPPRPRCGNPLATILHFEESSRFVPIEFDLFSGPSSPSSSPLQER